MLMLMKCNALKEAKHLRCYTYVPADFVVIETGGDEKSPIILGRPFLTTAGAIMYAKTAKICFNIK
jgi:hypothetical protein